MLATIVWDAYGNNERRRIMDAITALIPEGSPDWSRKGIYAYWDPETRDLLYVGLATDLVRRFGQHNRLITHSGGNKADKIDEWFETHSHLGLSLLLQSAAVETLDHLHKLDPTMGVGSPTIAKIAEGQLIELHRLEHGSWPPWNGVGGAVQGAEWARRSGRPIIRLLAAQASSLFVARRSLRDLAGNELDRRREALIHAARMRALSETTDLNPWDPSLQALDPDQMVERISRHLMLREGKLVDDFGDLDDEIRKWMRNLARADERIEENVRILDGLRDLDAVNGSNPAAIRYIASLVSQGGEVLYALQAAEILANGYLDLRPPHEPPVADPV